MAMIPLAESITASSSYTVPAGKLAIFDAQMISSSGGTGAANLRVGGVTVARLDTSNPRTRGGVVAQAGTTVSMTVAEGSVTTSLRGALFDLAASEVVPLAASITHSSSYTVPEGKLAAFAANLTSAISGGTHADLRVGGVAVQRLTTIGQMTGGGILAPAGSTISLHPNEGGASCGLHGILTDQL